MKKNIFFGICFAVLLFCCFYYPVESYELIEYSFMLWLKKLAPFLFPFLILTNVIMQSGLLKLLAPLFYPLARLYRTSPSAIFAVLCGCLGGQPTGVKTVSQMVIAGEISAEEAQNISAFCSMSSPSFILTSVGLLLYQDARVGTVLLLSSVLSVLFTGLFFRRPKGRTPLPAVSKPKPAGILNILISAITNSTYTVILVGSYIIFFGFAAGILNRLGIFSAIAQLIIRLGINVQPEAVTGFLWGAIEITGGADQISALALNLPARLILTSIIINWGGLSVHAQSTTFLSEAGLSANHYLRGKLIQPFIAGIATGVLCLWML
mgnify:CR=1 FL=1|jgi:sporulation integral membrane protein YlbJ